MRNEQLIEALSKFPPDLQVRTNDDGAWRGLTGWPKIGWVGESDYDQRDEPFEGGVEVILIDEDWDEKLIEP